MEVGGLTAPPGATALQAAKPRPRSEGVASGCHEVQDSDCFHPKEPRL